MQMELSKPNPATWPKDLMPLPHQIHGLRIGSIVKLYARSGSAIWCRIVEHDRTAKLFTGAVEDTTHDGLRRGDQVMFAKRDVWEVC